MFALLLAAQTTTSIPAYAAYAEPEPDAIEIDDRAATSGWKSAKQSLVWYGETKGPVKLHLAVLLAGPTTGRLTMTVGGQRHPGALRQGRIDFGTFDVKKGALRAALTTDAASGPEVASLEADGAVRWAMSKRRNAASVHLRWPTPQGADVRWFYNEAAMLTDPEWSYTMACGFARGYFGMQVNSPTERRVIFSVWDAGNEAVDRDRVSDENRVQLVAKGEGVVADSFGNEGTGGHSHLVYPWRTGKPLRFLVGCRPEGERTLYAGYFMAPGDKTWRLVAAFRAPKDGKSLGSLYSFSEDFVGANGQRKRESAYGHGWLGMADGSWVPLTMATFTTDGHGKADRWDYDAFVKEGRFHLLHGGFLSGRARYGDSFEAKAGKRPKFDLPNLPQ